MPSENHETRIVDHYYSWGWTRTDCSATVLPMPATKLSNRKPCGADNRKTGILWVATTAPRYLRQFPMLPDHFQEYLDWQMRFARALKKEIVAETRLRPHRDDHGWQLVQRLREVMSSIKIDSSSNPFLGSLRNCRLYVCDHLSTTFAEALAVNKPTILFWNPETTELRPEAQLYYSLLRQNGILFDKPEDAAHAINTIYTDVEGWWNDAERQSAVQTFCARFARTTTDAKQLWLSEFKEMAIRPNLTGQQTV